MDVDGDAHTIGRRVRQIRYARSKSLRVVAGLAGMSKSKLSLIERGELALDSRSDIVALANALQVAPSELTKVDVPAPGNGESDAVTAKIRCAMQGALVGAPDGRVCPIEQLSVRVDAVGRLKQRCANGELGAMLPELIGDLYASIAAGRNDAQLLRLAVELHTNGTQTYLYVMRASDDLRLVAASLANDAAERLDDPVSLGVAAFGFHNVLLASGSFTLADGIVRRAGVTPGVDVELAGMLALATSLTAAAGKRPADAEAALDYAADLAVRTGEGNRFFLSFGPTNVTLWRMAAVLEAKDYERTVALAETVAPERIQASARRAGYWMSYGRALARLRGRQKQAVMALRKAELISPNEVQRHPFVREVLGELLVRSRRDALGVELRGMAYRAGLPM
ncbi:MAG: helix-turn-helix domain-containing protein [Pseudonocardiales bacterium]|nr:helix-turn-helix domain-containing protein [Pseudonocardiales bacterium]